MGSIVAPLAAETKRFRGNRKSEGETRENGWRLLRRRLLYYGDGRFAWSSMGGKEISPKRSNAAIRSVSEDEKIEKSERQLIELKTIEWTNSVLGLNGENSVPKDVEGNVYR